MTFLQKFNFFHNYMDETAIFVSLTRFLMRRVLMILLFTTLFAPLARPQAISYGKSLPIRAFSLTAAPVYNAPNIYNLELRGISGMVMAGYGITYDVDLNLRYGYYGGSDFFGASLQYLFRETRNNYYSFNGGIHKWEEYGIDLTLRYTHTPQYWLNLAVALDLDFDFSNSLELRAWVPLNFGINLDDRYFLFFEYNLPANERAWDILTAGVTFIFR